MLIIIITALYAVDKIFMQKLNSSFSTTIQQDALGSIGKKHGFQMAFSFNEWLVDLSVPISDPRKVTIMAEFVEWEVPENSTVTVNKS